VVEVLLVVEVLVVVVVTIVYSTRSSGAASGSRSYASATRWPLPVMMSASALPLVHPGRFTISWTTPVRTGVRWAVPAVPTVGHDAGDQGTAAAVRGRA